MLISGGFIFNLDCSSRWLEYGSLVFNLAITYSYFNKKPCWICKAVDNKNKLNVNIFLEQK